MEGKPLILAQLGISSVVIFIGLLVMYGGMDPPEAPPRPKAPPAGSIITERIRDMPAVYRALLEQDSKKFHLNAPTMAELGAPIPYFDEVVGKRQLKPGKAINTRHLKIELKIQKQQATVDGQSFRADHLVLEIVNKTNKYLAYRVVTQVPTTTKCISKGEVGHNAIVLSPDEKVQRTECLYKTGVTIDLLSVEVMELLPLSAYYVSRVPPLMLLYESRTSNSHIPLVQPMCRQMVNWSEIAFGVKENRFSWKDLVDYYARHSCDEYQFFAGYTYREDDSAPLPARPARAQ